MLTSLCLRKPRKQGASSHQSPGERHGLRPAGVSLHLHARGGAPTARGSGGAPRPNGVAARKTDATTAVADPEDTSSHDRLTTEGSRSDVRLACEELRRPKPRPPRVRSRLT
jgi:hypothetical protein